MNESSLKVIVLYDAGADAGFCRPGEVPPEEDIRPVAEEIERCLKRLGYRASLLPVLDPIEKTAERIRFQKPDFIFNICEGFKANSGQEGNVAGLLETMSIPFTGGPAFTLHLALHKARVKEILRANGIPTPKWIFAETPFFPWKRQVPLPAIVKPAEEDASVGIEPDAVVRSVRAMRRRVEFVLAKYRQPALVEQFIEGREFNVALVGSRILEISEIDFSRLPRSFPRIVSYRGKWDPKSEEYLGTVPRCPVRLPKKKRAEAEAIAARTMRLLRGRDYARVDMRMDRKGNFYVLEFNSNPDLSPDAGMARCARARGWSYRRLIGEIARLAAERIPREVREASATSQA